MTADSHTYSQNQTTALKQARDLHFTCVAGEVSGDNIGAPLMAALKQKHANSEFWGVGHERMEAEGLQPLFPIDDIAVMGFVEPLLVLPRLINRKNSLVRETLQRKPDAYIGIDAPDFNLRIARDIKANNPDILTVHYVSPSVWAWRQSRIFGIQLSIDLMITLFPFESEFYDKYDVPNICVGHPMAANLPIDVDKQAKRRQLAEQSINSDEVTAQATQLIALLPGSRKSEIERHLPIYLRVAEQLAQVFDCEFVIPIARAHLRPLVGKACESYSHLNIKLLDGQSELALQAADAALVTSGTATLEALFCQCPMVVGYKTSFLNYQIAKRMVKTDFIALPNLLEKNEIVPEFIQAECTEANLTTALSALLKNESHRRTTVEKFQALHEAALLGGSQAAADEILSRISQAK